MKAAGIVRDAVIAIAVAAVGVGGDVAAFHSGGTAECGGCHSMHSAHTSGSHLLKQSDASSVCLSCHQDTGTGGPSGFHIATPESSMPPGSAPVQRTPGGDFGWLKKDYSYAIGGVTIRESGSAHGHNIVAADFGFSADATNATAPGGAFSASELACTSCHDPHGSFRRMTDGSVVTTGAPIIASGSYDSSPIPQAGQAVGAYRLLAGSGYTKGGVVFNGVPPAVAPADYNRPEATTQTRVAYGNATGNGRDTWARWCTTCHPRMSSHGHPTDEALGSSHRSNYASYVRSGDMSGTFTASYQSLVPFVENGSDFASLATHARSDDTAMSGPYNGDLVSCLSCHRAHASGWEHMMRWNTKATFLAYDGLWPGTDTTPGQPEYARGRTSAETRAAYYDRPVTAFASYQRTLCNKCHARD